MNNQSITNASLPANDAVSHIPGEAGMPFFGHLFELLRDHRAMRRRMIERYGPVFKTRALGQWSITLADADGLQQVLLDRDKNFSSAQGWHSSIGTLFQRGLMLLDFDEHRYHRRIMQAAFKRDALEHYLGSMHSVSVAALQDWRREERFLCYPAVKQLTLDNAAVAFLGLPLDERAAALNQAFVDTVAASLAPIRWPIPGLAYKRGLDGRALLARFFREQIPTRRASDANDMFTRLCHATDDEGRAFSDDDIVNHMIFLLMAAHDTLTSSLTVALYGLAAHPEWQERLRDEHDTLAEGPLTYADVDQLEQTGWVFNEALRLWGPVPLVPRRTQRAFVHAGVEIPANTQIIVSPDHAHRDPTVWTNPDAFDPERFSAERAEH
ncbi:MAG: cytochrome P450, partial [Pseudomonadota bacterium]